MNHFKEDTNLLNFNICINSINKQTNYELKSLANWLNFSKTPLNVDKAELGLFHSIKKQLDCDLKIRLNVKRLYETDKSNVWEIKFTEV